MHFQNVARFMRSLYALFARFMRFFHALFARFTRFFHALFARFMLNLMRLIVDSLGHAVRGALHHVRGSDRRIRAGASFS